MKAAIVELREKKAAALLSDGTVVIIPNRSYALGQEIEYRSPADTARKTVAWAAGVAAILCISLGAYAYQSPYSYVSLDVNPSIEFSLNRFDQVLRVTAVNTDAQAIVTELYHQDISHQNIAQAVELTITSLSEQHYFENEGSYVLIAAASQDTKKAEQLVLTLEQTARLAEGSPEELRVETVSGEPEQVEEARKAGVTLGKKQLVDEIEKSTDPSKPFDYNEWLHKPVKEIVEEAEKNDKPKKNEEAPSASPTPEPEKTPKPSKEKDSEKYKTPKPSSSNGNKGSGQQQDGNGGKEKPVESEKNQHGGSSTKDKHP